MESNSSVGYLNKCSLAERLFLEKRLAQDLEVPDFGFKKESSVQKPSQQFLEIQDAVVLPQKTSESPDPSAIVYIPQDGAERQNYSDEINLALVRRWRVFRIPVDLHRKLRITSNVLFVHCIIKLWPRRHVIPRSEESEHMQETKRNAM